MNRSLDSHLEALKATVRSVPDTGESGFEGLIGAALREITGAPLRLARSGSQFGLDGKTAFEGDSISFEGKQYNNPIPRNEVLSKLAELPLRNEEIEIWVLGASVAVSTQLADDARARGLRDGLFVVILDWSPTGLPLLAVALAMGGVRVEQFLADTIQDEDTVAKACAALEAVRNSGEFESVASRIRHECCARYPANAPSATVLM